MKFKHIISLLLAVVLVLGMALPAYAEEAGSTVVTGDLNSNLSATSPEIPVTLESKEGYVGAVETVLGVEITWNVGTLQFEKVTNYGVKWNPETLKYEKVYQDNSGRDYGTRYNIKTGTDSTPDLSVCTVANRSLMALDVAATFTPHEQLQFDSYTPDMIFFYEGTLSPATANNKPDYNATDVGDAEGKIGGTTTITMRLKDTAGLSKWVQSIDKNNLTSFGTVTLTFSKATQ